MTREKYPAVSIIIITWNRCEDVDITLSELMNVDYPNCEVILVDNNSNDGTSDLVRLKYPQVKLIVLEKNIGIAAKNNGIEAAQGDYIITLDDDSHFEKDYIKKVITLFADDPDLSVICSRVINTRDGHIETDDFEHAIIPDSEKGGYLYYDFHGVGAAFRRTIFDRAGFFSNRFHAYLEENELSIRILEAGGKIKYYPGLIAFHRVTSVGRNSSLSTYWKIRNHGYVLLLHFGWIDIILQSVVRYPLFFIDYVIRDHNFLAFIKGFVRPIRELGSLLRERRVVSKKTRDLYIFFFWRLEKYRLSKRIKNYLKRLSGVRAKCQQ